LEVVQVQTEPRCEVRIGRGLLAKLSSSTASYSRVAVLTDENVARLHRAKLAGLDAAPTLAVVPGEASKSLATLERVLDFMVESSLDRRSVLVALGGGVVGDLGGLAASLYMRGIACAQAPTTLLAQVDASVGGKTAVNLRAGKNLAGTFHQPVLVVADTDVLATLPDGEFLSGLGEVVKSALIGGEAALAQLESSADAIVARDGDALASIVAACVRTKAAIVARDPHERGERKQLNLGHTFAHGIEHAAGYGRIPHGIAVGVGILLALAASREAGALGEPELLERVRELLSRLRMPTDLATLRKSSSRALAPSEILAGMRHDKKGAAGKPRLVLATKPGRIVADVEVDVAVLERCLASA
jgi:3-dehydroquinate synthase